MAPKTSTFFDLKTCLRSKAPHSSCRDKVHIPCSGETVNEMGYAPGVKFWQAIQASGESKLDIARDCLEMSQEDVEKALQAVDDYVERQKSRAEKKQRRLKSEGGATIPKMKKLEHWWGGPTPSLRGVWPQMIAQRKRFQLTVSLTHRATWRTRPETAEEMVISLMAMRSFLDGKEIRR